MLHVGWQPIDTAPKDGSLVLAVWAGEEFSIPRFVRWVYNPRTKTTFWNDFDEWDSYENEDNPPTYWFPLPEFPLPPQFAGILEEKSK